MSKSTEQHTDVDQRIRDFVDRKSTPWYSLGQSIIDRLSTTMTTRSVKNKEIGYEALQWRQTPSQRA